MVLTTLLLRPRKTAENATCHSLLSSLIGLGLIALCLPLLMGCADGVSSGDGLLAMAKAGKGHAYGLNPTISLSPTGLAISAIQGGSDPAAQTVAPVNAVHRELNRRAGDAAE